MPEFRERAEFWPVDSLAGAEWTLTGNGVTPFAPDEGEAAFPAITQGLTRGLYVTARATFATDASVRIGLSTLTRNERNVGGILAALASASVTMAKGGETILWKSAVAPTLYPAGYVWTSRVQDSPDQTVANPYVLLSMAGTVTPSAGASAVTDWVNAVVTIADDTAPETRWAQPMAAGTIVVDETGDEISEETSTIAVRYEDDFPLANSRVRWRGKDWRIVQARATPNAYVEIDLLRPIRAG